jgi:hypothetical protein
MPRYRITLAQKVWQTASFEIDASRYSEATMKANDLLLDVERGNVDLDDWSTGDSEEGSLGIDSVELIKEPHRFDEADTGMSCGVCGATYSVHEVRQDP